jgi:hypothetical protein
MAIQEFIPQLLNKVFKFIQEKNALVIKRATWNIKRQEEKIEKAKKKRS